jgi:hypothetical protein
MLQEDSDKLEDYALINKISNQIQANSSIME